MAPKTNHWIHKHVTKTKMAPNIDRIKLKLKRIYEHVSTAEMAPKTKHTKSNWIHVHVTSSKMAQKLDQMKLKWIHFLNTIIELPPKTYTPIAKIAPKKQINVLESIKSDNITNNITSITLPLFLFMINLNLPTMSGAHEHKKTTDHNWIPIRHNLWHNTHISIEKYQSIAMPELTSNHSLQKPHTNYLRDRTWSFTYSLFYFMFKLSEDHKETTDHEWTPNTHSPLLSTYPNRSGWSNQRHQSTVNQHYLGAPPDVMHKKK